MLDTLFYLIIAISGAGILYIILDGFFGEGTCDLCGEDIAAHVYEPGTDGECLVFPRGDS